MVARQQALASATGDVLAVSTLLSLWTPMSAPGPTVSLARLASGLDPINAHRAYRVGDRWRSVACGMSARGLLAHGWARACQPLADALARAAGAALSLSHVRMAFTVLPAPSSTSRVGRKCGRVASTKAVGLVWACIGAPQSVGAAHVTWGQDLVAVVVVSGETAKCAAAEL